MLEQILANCLGNYQYSGFTLSEIDDHLLELRFMGKKVAFFSSMGATGEQIRNICKQYLEEHGKKGNERAGDGSV